jgi:hypothetical protein
MSPFLQAIQEDVCVVEHDVTSAYVWVLVCLCNVCERVGGGGMIGEKRQS